MDYQKIIDTIFELNDDIRYAGLIDETGSLIVGGMRHGIDSIVDKPSEKLYLTPLSLKDPIKTNIPSELELFKDDLIVMHNIILE